MKKQDKKFDGITYSGVTLPEKPDWKALDKLIDAQPAQSRLLTDEETIAWMRANKKDGFVGDYYRESQRDLTASIKDKEWDKRCAEEKAEFGLSVHEAAEALCQARMEELLEWGNEKCSSKDHWLYSKPPIKRCCTKCWQELKANRISKEEG